MQTAGALADLRAKIAAIAVPWLSQYKPRRYRSSTIVRDVVWGMIDILPHELGFIDSPLFQRLRRVRQTSLALLTYPSAGHSRFEHSLGCLNVADRVLRVLQRRIGITEKDRLVIRLAALLHDCTHGPFSHASEGFYKLNPTFAAVKSQYPELFERSSASEIVTYCFLTSEPFGKLWHDILAQYEGTPTAGLLSDQERWRIATMIVGADYNPERQDASPGAENRYLRQLVNGPFDVDKLDYIARDGYFTGLNLAIDVERLLWVLDTIDLETDSQGRHPRILCVGASGAPVLEQILFSKMQLYSSVYHHHKVRVAYQAILRLLACLQKAGVQIRGELLDSPAIWLSLDDSDILHASFQQAADPPSPALEGARMLTGEIQNRQLPMRALVLTHPVWGSDPCNPSDTDRKTWELKMKAPGQPALFSAQIAGAAELPPDDVWVDIPGPAPLEGTAQEGIVKFDAHTYVAIGEVFPIGGWLSGYQAYRTISYVFARSQRERVGRAAIKVLSSKEYGVTVNDVSLKLARIDDD